MWKVAAKKEPIPYHALSQALIRTKVDIIQDNPFSHARMGLMKAYSCCDYCGEIFEFPSPPEGEGWHHDGTNRGREILAGNRAQEIRILKANCTCCAKTSTRKWVRLVDESGPARP